MQDEPRAVLEFPYRFEIVTLEDTFVDAKYQRKLTSLADEIAEDFNPGLIGTLTLSERTGEKGAPKGRGGQPYAVVDGQTRRAGSMKRIDEDGNLDPVIALPALIYSDMTRQDEAAMFSLLQRKRRAIATHERFKASVVAEEEEAMGIVRTLKHYGYEVGPRGAAGSKTIQAVNALEVTYRRDPRLLDATIRVIDKAWGDGEIIAGDVFAQDIIRGVARTISNPRMTVDHDRLINRLAKTSPGRLRINANHLRESRDGKGTNMALMAEVILGQYGKR